MTEPNGTAPAQEGVHPLHAFDATRDIDPEAAEKFRERASADVRKILDRMSRLRTVPPSRTYQYTYAQVEKIRETLQAALDGTMAEFEAKLEQLRVAASGESKADDFTL